MQEDKIRKHESYGLISVHRITAPDIPLFGSPITHRTAVMIEIHEASTSRHLSQDWHMTDRMLFRGIMSSEQFAEAAFQTNLGSGTPITLEYVAGDSQVQREPPPMPTHRDDFAREIQEHLSRPLQRLQALRETAKTQREKKEIEGIIQDLKNNIPFVESQFAAQMEQAVAGAKADIESQITQKLVETGINATIEEIEQLRRAKALPESTVQEDKED